MYANMDPQANQSNRGFNDYQNRGRGGLGSWYRGRGSHAIGVMSQDTAHQIFRIDCLNCKKRKKTIVIRRIRTDDPRDCISQRRQDRTKQIRCQHRWREYLVLDNGARNHMTGDKQYFMLLDDSITRKVKSGDDSWIVIKGKGSTEFNDRNGETRTMTEVY